METLPLNSFERSELWDTREDLEDSGVRGEGSVVLVRSYLDPERSKRLDISRSLRVDWFKQGDLEEKGFDSDIFLASKDLSDEEFFDRLRSDGRDERVISRLIVPPPVYREVVSWTERVNWNRLGVWTTAVVLTIALGTILSVGILHLTRPEISNASLEAPKPVSVGGIVSYRTKSGRIEGDEGAFIFFFPADKPFKKPLISYGATPNKLLPLKFDLFLKELEENGGYFEQIGFEGFFSLEVKRPGDYCVLIVSYHLDGNLAGVDKKTIREIGRYLFGPEEMLERNKFLWTTRTFDGEECDLDFEIGKADR